MISWRTLRAISRRTPGGISGGTSGGTPGRTPQIIFEGTPRKILG